MATNKKSTTAATSVKSSSTRPHRQLNAPTVQNFHLVWLDGSIDELNNDDYYNSITQLRHIVNTVNTFTDVDECIDFITDIEHETIFMIVSGPFSQIIVPVVQDISQVSSVYIYCKNKASYEKWTQQWCKVKDVYTDITPICDALKQAAQACDHNSVSISFVKATDGVSNQNLEELHSSFMYTQILKEILLTIDFEQVQINEFVTYCREQFVGNTTGLRNVDKIEKEYFYYQPIWWYTYDCFLYSMLNRALRLMEVDLIIKMGFFIRDLHKNIAALYTEQYGGHRSWDSFTVYRGQGLSQADFDQLKNTKGGLMSFNSFLSTSLDQEVSFAFAKSNLDNPDLTGVLFRININPSIFSSQFANIGNDSYFKAEGEILFSMNSVFRIGHLKPIDEDNRLWQVNLTLTDDNDPQLHALTERMREEIFSDVSGWCRLGNLLVKLGRFDKVHEIFDIMLDKGIQQLKEAKIDHMFGVIKNDQGNYVKRVGFFEKALEIMQKILPSNHLDLATFYNSIGMVHDKMAEYSKALPYYEKEFEIKQKILPANHLDLAISYNNIGGVYDNMREHWKALLYYEKALEIYQKTLPANHSHLVQSYNNISQVYYRMGEYRKALSYNEKALEIRQKTLPENHPNLATYYNNIGLVYSNMGEYSKALPFHEKALEIMQKTLPANHPDLASSYNNISLLYYNMGQYSKALPYYEKLFDIRQKTLFANHPDLANYYHNIGLLYDNMGQYSKALSYNEKALEIRQKTLPANHPDLAAPYYNIGLVNYNMGEYSKALSYFRRAQNIWQNSLPSNHLYLENVRRSIEQVQKKLRLIALWSQIQIKR